ncbi:hypothetical protein [Donghicola mangrovi]|nr:hypothetical protein [Donghicola mangrovi]
MPKFKLLPMLIAAALSCAGTASFAGGFSFSFEWGGIPSCTTGRPKTVPNPVFTLKDVPAGTTWIYFKLVDKNVPGYDHGGGWVAYNGQARIEPGAFKYKSPCPPGGKHTYEWTATAKSKKSAMGKALGSAKAAKEYP